MFILLIIVFLSRQHIIVAFVYLCDFVIQYNTNRLCHNCSFMNK